MKKIVIIFLLISIFLLTCNEREINKGDIILINNQKELTINGDIVNSLYIATTDFLTYHYPIERYEVKLKEEKAFFYILFLPKIEEVDYETANWGRQEFGGSITYHISKKTYEIEKKYLGR